DDIILHHYWESPYAEKIRRILGFKRLAWRSVIIPMIMPKPDLTALTGGYRKTPVLQLGADIYCDTDLITGTIERLHPEPTLFPPVWPLKMVPQTTAILEPFAHVRAWMERIEAFGHGQITEIDGKEAVEVARTATPRTETRVDPEEPNGLKPGDRVEVVHESFGRDPVTG